MTDYATDAEIAEAIDQGRKEAADKLAKRAAREIGESTAVDGGHPPLKSGEFEIPDPPSDTILDSLYRSMQILNAKMGGVSTHHDRDRFDGLIRETFAEHGVIVDVKWFNTNVDNVFMPEIQPYAVTDMHGRSIPDHPDYDPDEQVHNVVNDSILNTGKKGIIKGSGKLWTP